MVSDTAAKAKNSAKDPMRSAAGAYLSALSAVAIESLAMKAAPHQFDPGRPGLIGVLATPLAV